MKPNQELLCKDCIHSKISFMDRIFSGSVAYICTIPEAKYAEEIDLVTGKVRKGFNRTARSMRVDYECGPEGKRWAPKKSKHIFLLLKHRG